jgi:PleD family two-component response regulator
MEISRLSPPTNGLPPQPVLLAEIDPKQLNSLSQTLKSTIPHLSVDLCNSRDCAISQLSSDPYHVIITNANFAVMDSCSLLKGYQSIRSQTPFLVTIGSSEHALARQALRAGAFDVLVNPIDAQQIVGVVRPALWLYQLRFKIHLHRNKLRQYQQRLDASTMISPTDRQILKQDCLDIEKAHSACERSIKQIEDSLRHLQNIAHNIEVETRQRSCRAFNLPYLKTFSPEWPPLPGGTNT